MEYGSTHDQTAATVTADGSEDRKSPATGHGDAHREGAGISPKDVARRIFGSNPTGVPCLQGGQPTGISDRKDHSQAERQAVGEADFLPRLKFLSTIDARGTEHAVRFRGGVVEKHQHCSGWIPVVTPQGKIGVDQACPSEYLHRLDLQNELFGDDIEVIGITRGDRFAITQPTLKGGEPSENEIRDVLEAGGWRRIPIGLQDLPPALMGSAWWHEDEQLILLDARKPNFKKTDFGTLPIDLILADLTPEMRQLLNVSSAIDRNAG